MSITNAMLCRVSFHGWTARKRDRRAESAVNARYDANDAGVFTKQLIDAFWLKELHSITSRAKTVYHRYTMPWQDRGARILPTAVYMRFVEEMNKVKTQHAGVKSRFLDVYESAIDARRADLGELFDDDDYPSREFLEDRLRIDVSFAPIPAGEDFRCALKDSDVIAAQIDQESIDAVSASVDSLKCRIKKDASVLLNGLARLDKDEKARLKEAAISNLISTAQLVRDLNFTKNQQLNHIAHKLESEAKSFDVLDLRADELARSDAANKVNEILDKLEVIS